MRPRPAVLADLLDPPPVVHPFGWETPLDFGEATGRGRYRRAAHLEAIEREVLRAVETAGRLIISVSVRHGKSHLVSRILPAWYLGRHPDRRVILAGHEADFAASHGRAARDLLTEYGRDIFGVSVSRRSEAANRWDLARPNDGGMLTVGVGGSPLGRGADLLLVDDPIKSWEDAMSPTKRRKIIEWWTGTIEHRIEPGGAAIIICARWHTDDLSGFLLREAPEEWREVRMPAICDDPANDPLGRRLGEPLWPERYPLDELERRRRAVSLALGDRVWEAQFQQTPKAASGGMFPEDRWSVVTEAPACRRWVRAWDLAATEGGGDATVGALLGLTADRRIVVADVVTGRWSPDDVRATMLATAQADGRETKIRIPQDPGQAGKDQAAQLTRLLAGYDVEAVPPSGSKEVRATGFSAQQRAGNVVLVDGPWVGGFIAELAEFPMGRHDDQVDAASDAFNTLVGWTPKPPPETTATSAELPSGPAGVRPGRGAVLRPARGVR